MQLGEIYLKEEELKLIIEPPTWIGDAVMASGAIAKLIEAINPKELIYFGSNAALDVLGIKDGIINKKDFNTFKKFPKGYIFISFRRSLYSKLLGLKSKRAFFFSSKEKIHYVQRYNNYVNRVLESLNIEFDKRVYKPQLNAKKINLKRPTIGINPGAAYGSAKRWYPKEFAKVANYLAKDYDIIIFGGPGEEELAADIEKELTIKNYQNLCAKLNLTELKNYLASLNGLITNDSGPMHIAAALNIPIVAIYGPTDYRYSHPYNTKYKIVTKNLECAPCGKRVCPLKTHECMKEIKAIDVIEAIEKSKIFNQNSNIKS